MIKKFKQSGSVSLFIVVFAALLITVVSIGFVSVMIQDQQQASTTDLSQSAYDSAQAGVEDAKRALLRYQSICDSGGDCLAAQSKIDSATSPKCNASVETLDDVKSAASPNGEVQVQTGGSNALDQAYTCVKINLNTTDYLGTLSANSFNTIPLKSISPFDTVQIQWFNSSDLNSNTNFDVNLQNPVKGAQLLAQNSWLPNRPSIIRTQLIQFGSNGFTLNDFDNKNALSESDTNSLFLYPSGNTGVASPTVNTFAFSNRDIRKTPTGSPLLTTCSGNLTSGGYACNVKLTLPTPINGGDRTAFLRLGAIYNKTNFRVTLYNGATPVMFNGVQPAVDSTGRANDLFRRVQARVELIDTNFPYPVGAIDISGSLCKSFIITDSSSDYSAGNCTP